MAAHVCSVGKDKVMMRFQFCFCLCFMVCESLKIMCNRVKAGQQGKGNGGLGLAPLPGVSRLAQLLIVARYAFFAVV